MHLGLQGGNVDPTVLLDLGTCVNPYGPAPAAIDALRTIPSEIVQKHPYSAAAKLEDVYADKLQAEARHLVATRAASEAIWHLSSIFATQRVALPLPAYTEYLRCFPSAQQILNERYEHHVAQLAMAAQHADMVLFSNPHNPTATALDRETIESIAKRFPECMFVADESYADFLATDLDVSVINSACMNVAAIRSPTKFFGLGGIRVGVVWSRNATFLDALRNQRTTWPLSMLDVMVTEAAFVDTEWQDEARKSLTQDAVWLDGWLGSMPDLIVHPGRLHFRLVSGNTSVLTHALGRNGIVVRKLEAAHGVPSGAIRMSAPQAKDRHLVENVNPG